MEPISTRHGFVLLRSCWRRAQSKRAMSSIGGLEGRPTQLATSLKHALECVDWLLVPRGP